MLGGPSLATNSRNSGISGRGRGEGGWPGGGGRGVPAGPGGQKSPRGAAPRGAPGSALGAGLALCDLYHALTTSASTPRIRRAGLKRGQTVRFSHFAGDKARASSTPGMLVHMGLLRLEHCQRGPIVPLVSMVV